GKSLGSHPEKERCDELAPAASSPPSLDDVGYLLVSSFCPVRHCRVAPAAGRS
ncbi:hypothetical protein OQ641_27170, partial [Klebsiella pneumoniae]|nr:hypothetical protein [Klebsiella pneumoniae]